MPSKTTHKTAPNGRTHVICVTAPYLVEAVDLLLDEIDELEPQWEPWKIEASRSIRGRRATAKLTSLHRDEVSERKNRRSSK